MPDQRSYPPSADSRLPHVGTYRRVLPVSLERMYENALDWQHLPHLHATSFSAIDSVDAGPWGWRATVTSSQGEVLRLELILDRQCHRWITRTLAGANAGSEVWTHAFVAGPRRTDVVVDFFVPDVAPADRVRLGAALARLYERLYDEDVAMMCERQRQLDRRIEPLPGATVERCLGAAEVLSLPCSVEHRGRLYHVVSIDGELCAHTARCPHQLGPLPASSDGSVRCPWHGYRFDVRTGECLSGQPHRLAAAPHVVCRDGRIWLIDPPSAAHE
jgi:nitrite reductase/ring-hydroxylating ferredoxin subunit